MATHKIFEHVVGNKSFEVWLTDGLLQFVVDGAIRHDIDSVTDFLIEAAREINKPNGTDDDIVKSNGSVADRAVENVEGGSLVLDTGGTNPSISLGDNGTEVKIGGGGVGGSLRIDFGTGPNAASEASQFLAFAEDLLGKAEMTEVGELTDVEIGDFTRTVTVSTRDDDVHQIKFKSTGDQRDLSWADIFVEDLAGQFGGSQISNGNVADKSYSANQLKIDASDDTLVNLGSQGVGGKEVYDFATSGDADSFFDAMKTAFEPGSDRGAIINEAILIIADSLDGSQIRDGNVNVNYTASQIKLVGAEKNQVDLGNHRVGGKEVYAFNDQETAQKFIDLVRDAVGVEAHEGRLVEEHIYQVSGGAGIGGSPTFVGKDDFVDFIASEFGGEQLRNGFASESFSGGVRLDGATAKLGPQGVGGQEIWRFDDEATAAAFRDTLDDLFG